MRHLNQLKTPKPMTILALHKTTLKAIGEVINGPLPTESISVSRMANF